MYSAQKLFCRACGKEMLTTFNLWGGEVCSRRCSQELNWRRTLSILGKDYYPDPTPLSCICGVIAEKGDYCRKCLELINRASEAVKDSM